MEFQPLHGGMEFGLRFLNQIKWAKANFDFQYLLKVDDDYFVCLKRLISEIPSRPTRNLLWGHFHCEAGITWIDEAFVIFTSDVIYKFLAQDEKKMLCHPFADQQIGLWMKNLTKRYFHDPRLHRHPPASFMPKFKNMSNVCDSYLGVHGTYVDQMRDFGRRDNDGEKFAMATPEFSTRCRTTRFDHRVFGREFSFKPRPCIENPTWNNSTVMPLIYSRENFGPKKPASEGGEIPKRGSPGGGKQESIEKKSASNVTMVKKMQ
ncbi:uncharacterized protein LOC144638277 [Oculina patagonica]